MMPEIWTNSLRLVSHGHARFPGFSARARACRASSVMKMFETRGSRSPSWISSGRLPSGLGERSARGRPTWCLWHFDVRRRDGPGLVTDPWTRR